MFFACNISFIVTEHPQFFWVIQLVRPGYTPPSRKAIGGILLDNVHNQLTQDVRDSVSGKTATLVRDGWSNIHNEPIVASCLQVEGSREMWCATWLCRTGTSVIVRSCFFSIHWEDFSSFVGIHTKIRLGNEKIAMLVFCHRILQGICDLHYWCIKWMDSIEHVWKMWESGYWIKDTSKLFLLLLITELEKM